MDASLPLSMDSEQTFELAGATVVGRVVDRQGAPVSSATVMASSTSDGTLLRRVSTDGRGAFRMDRLASGPVRLHASHVGAAGQQELLVHAGQTETVEIILESEDGLALRLRDGGSGTAVQVATFGIQDRRGGYLVLGQRGDPTGLFTLPVQANEVAAVVVAAPRFALATVRNLGAGARPLEVPLWANYRAFTLEVRPEAGQPCSVELLARDGLPVALTVGAPPGPLPLQSPTGLFNLLAPGSYTLVVTPCRGQPLARPLALLEGVDPPHVIFP